MAILGLAGTDDMAGTSSAYSSMNTSVSNPCKGRATILPLPLPFDRHRDSMPCEKRFPTQEGSHWEQVGYTITQPGEQEESVWPPDLAFVGRESASPTDTRQQASHLCPARRRQDTSPLARPLCHAPPASGACVEVGDRKHFCSTLLFLPENEKKEKKKIFSSSSSWQEQLDKEERSLFLLPGRNV